jgi:hypothetical protein
MNSLVLLQPKTQYRVRGYDFRDTASDGQIHVSMFEHSLDEVCGFVDGT